MNLYVKLHGWKLTYKQMKCSYNFSEFNQDGIKHSEQTSCVMNRYFSKTMYGKLKSVLTQLDC